MNNVHRLVVPVRDGGAQASAGGARHMGEVLILPCIRYERMDGRDSAASRRTASASQALDPFRQDLTA
ncbi:hypothetical protein D3218_07865 [Aureimonas flava]|uniref:Uncharacterized protein n=1 Tax=Aureimonas flava TaxID=2320271 RepID=A0A3A1WMQ7_9HYPH|nr:hypothetical protein [Aureimonas flava]RIY01277.1 hypothetical protein D3218_07865 [Aureimonas flava]